MKEKLKRLRKFPVRSMAIAIGFVAMIVFFSIASSNFFTPSNINNILLATMINGVLSVGALFVIVAGGIDVSVGTNMTFISVMLGMFMTWWGMPAWLGIICGLLFGALIGVANGIMVTKMKITPFIATLGMQMVTAGLAIVITNGTPIYFTSVAGYQKIALGSPFTNWFARIGISDYVVNTGVIIMFFFAIVFGVILSKTSFGRYLYSIGNNREATRLSGIRVNKWELYAYIVSGCMSAVAAVLMTSRMNTAYPSVGGGYEMNAIAACVIGGASLAGGKGSMKGAILGAFIMSVLTNGLRLLSVSTEWQKVLTGVIIIVAVFIDIVGKSKKNG
jgi:ribose transport system permease protein